MLSGYGRCPANEDFGLQGSSIGNLQEADEEADEIGLDLGQELALAHVDLLQRHRRRQPLPLFAGGLYVSSFLLGSI